MKLSFLLIAGLMLSGLGLVSMTDRTQLCTSVIDEVEVVDPATSGSTFYFIDRSGGTGVVINGTPAAPPTPNCKGGHNLRCTLSQEICYQCTDCEELN